jgi:hypothetical protein
MSNISDPVGVRPLACRGWQSAQLQAITGYDICFVIGLFAYHVYSPRAFAAHPPHLVIAYSLGGSAELGRLSRDRLRTILLVPVLYVKG